MTATLTPKQENFCLSYLETGNASEAYRRAYDAERMKPESTNRKAFDLLENVKIAARLEELRQPAVEAAQVTLEDHLLKLADIRDKAVEVGQFGPAVTAEINRGKAAGLYVERAHIRSEHHASPTVKPAGISATLALLEEATRGGAAGANGYTGEDRLRAGEQTWPRGNSRL